jgi:hypothetical protein
MLGSSTQASRANHAWSAWQIMQRVREKNTARRPKLSRSVLMPVGIASPVCGHLIITIPMSPSLAIGLLYFERKHRPVGVRLLSVRVTWGASRTLFSASVGQWGLHARCLACSNRPDPSSEQIPRRELSGLFLACLVENLCEVLPDRLTRFGRKLLGKRPQFPVLAGSGVERLARLRRRQGKDIGR